MAYNRIIILLFLFVLGSCTADFHLRRAIAKNPHLLDSTIKYVPYKKDTTIYITIYIKGDTGTQETKRIVDSIQQVYNDSFTTVLQLVDSLGNLKTTVIRKPYPVHDTVYVEVKGEVPVTVPAQVVVEEKKEESVINWSLILGLIALILFLLLLHRFKK